MSTNPYWLYTWLASRKIESLNDAERELAKPGCLVELTQIAERWTDEAETTAGNNLVAGTGLRLNDNFSCPSLTCRRRQVDILFRHAWHYFDKVLIPDGTRELLLEKQQYLPKKALRRLLARQIEVVLHLQEIGATDLVQFYRAKPSPNPHKFQTPIPIAGDLIGACHDSAWTQVESTISKPELYQLEFESDGGCNIAYSDPCGEFIIPIHFSREAIGNNDIDWIRNTAAHDILHFHIASLENDLIVSKETKASLASVFWSHAGALSSTSGGPDTSNVLFELTFPSLSQIPIRELLSLRAQEGAAFNACRAALRQAAKEMLAESSTSNPTKIADAIRMDIVEPELSRLAVKLKSAQTAMGRKATFAIALTGVSTMCGLLLDGGTGAAAGATIGLLSSGGMATASKYCDERAEIESSDMFFLWKALGHAE
jgi:hypothetical protein